MHTTITRRLTTSFAIVVTLVLVGGCAGVYFGERFSLDRGLRRELAEQMREVRTIVARPGALGSEAFADRPDSYVAVLTRDGDVIAASAPLRERTLLTRAELHAARTGSHTFQRGSITHPGSQTFRIRTTTIVDAGKPRIALVALRRGSRDEALRELAGQLAIFGAAALALTILVGWQLTRAAMAPVESMRAEADELYRAGTGGRLTPPATHDELARLSATMNELLERVDRAVERERSFAAAAGHELRTPLAALKTELELAVHQPRSADELVAAIAAAHADVTQLIKLSEDLLLVSRSGTLRHHEPFDLVALVERTTSGASEVQVSLPNATVLIDGNEALIQRAIANLLENAAAYGAAPVRVDMTSDPNMATLVVSDAGPGFAPAFAASAFDTFSRDAADSSTAHAGLGLTIVRAVVEAHGGDVAIEAHTGRGARVRMGLPLSDVNRQ